MKTFLITGAAIFAFSGAAFADEAIVAPGPGPAPIVVEHRSDADVSKKVIVHHDAGCSSKTVKKTNDDGDQVSKTVSNC
jgi:hypothetical protein